MGRFVEGEDRRRESPLPASLDDYVGDNNPVRVVEAFIDELDLAVFGFDRDSQKVTARWSTGIHRLNFPMALDPSTGSALIAYRLPVTLARMDLATGATTQSQSTCGDPDDLFSDGKRTRRVFDPHQPLAAEISNLESGHSFIWFPS